MGTHDLRRGETTRCLSCRADAVTLQDIKGRAFDLRDEYDLVFDESLRLPVCGACGELHLRGTSLRRFSSVLERLHAAKKREAIESFVAVIDREFADVPRQSWEAILGISPGYLSRLLKGTRNLTTPLEVLMRGVAQEPAQALRFIAHSRRLPDALAEYLRKGGSRQRV
ncbi:MAG: hypothetical protein ACYC3F_07290 [Gemmatimonadaceae bacterium]